MPPMPPVDEQIRILGRGVAEVFSIEELKRKIARALAERKPLRVKLGVDPTAPDIHLGNAVPLWKMRAFQDLGHKAVLIIGDYTAMVGDPSGRNKTRPTLTKEKVDEYAETYLKQIGKILVTDDPERFELRRNSEWLSPMTFSDVLKLAGRMTVARMLERDDFSLRMKDGVPIALHEFLYPLMQGWDSVAIQSDVELGGTDQTFNNLVGRDFQRDTGQEPQVVLTMPLLEGTDGTKKMSKSLGNYIGISESPEEIYGKAMSIPDDLVRKYMTLATDVPEAGIDRLCSSATHPRDAKAALAFAIVRRYHGEEGAKRGELCFEQVHRKREMPKGFKVCPASSQGMSVAGSLICASLVASKREASRLISQGGVYVDGERVTDPSMEIDFSAPKMLQVGNRRFVSLVYGTHRWRCLQCKQETATDGYSPDDRLGDGCPSNPLASGALGPHVWHHI